MSYTYSDDETESEVEGKIYSEKFWKINIKIIMKNGLKITWRSEIQIWRQWERERESKRKHTL